MKASKRSEVRGKECQHHGTKELDEIFLKLKAKETDKQKKTMCINLEYLMREYDAKKYEGKRWFMNAIERVKRI